MNKSILFFSGFPGVLILLTFLLLSCSDKTEKTINYCERFMADQSNLARNYKTKAEKEESFKRRKADFKENWNIFKELMESDQLSPVGKDSCFLKFVTATLIHNTQNHPEEIFNKNTIDKLNKEVGKGNIRLNYLRTALIMYKDFTPEKKRCKEIKEMVDYAILTWKVNENLEGTRHSKIEDIEYVDCQ